MTGFRTPMKEAWMQTPPPAGGVKSERAACGLRAANPAIAQSEVDVRRQMARRLKP